jgi:hypothetical protein
LVKNEKPAILDTEALNSTIQRVSSAVGVVLDEYAIKSNMRETNGIEGISERPRIKTRPCTDKVIQEIAKQSKAAFRRKRRSAPGRADEESGGLLWKISV